MTNPLERTKNILKCLTLQLLATFVQEAHFGPNLDFSQLYIDYMFDLFNAYIAHVYSDLSMHFGAHKGTMVNGRDFFGSPFKLSWNLND
jgi:hypothetical protein